MSAGGQWQGQFGGEWGGAANAGEGTTPGELTGAASFGFTATGTLTYRGNILHDILGGGQQRAAKQQAADEHEQRIARQNQLIVALVTAAITEGIL